ncbi:MAG TPA: methyltransferase [Verrucomicrobiae bacterium]|jgi:hypothetical protein|nr:methyltransferase [Verrucomicrobiae bacterium]
MNEQNKTVTNDTVPSMAMLQMISAFRSSRAIYVAAKLGLADLLKDRPKSREELAQATGTHASSLYRVMRMLASIGIFAEVEEGLFALTPLAATLLSDAPGSLRAGALSTLGEVSYQTWGEIMHTVLTGRPAFDYVFGMGVWDYRAEHPEVAKTFDEAMANNIEHYNVAVLAEYPFSVFKNIVDVGGGDGSFLIALLKTNPAMNGVLFDLPHVAEKAKRRIAEADLVSRCEVVAGDVFTSVPQGGDAYVLSRLINAFENERAVAVLKACHKAMGGNSKLLLVQRVLPDRVEKSSTAQAVTVMDLQMMVNTGGCERTEAEHRALAESAGFRVTKVVPTQSEMTVIECQHNSEERW